MTNQVEESSSVRIESFRFDIHLKVGDESPLPFYFPLAKLLRDSHGTLNFTAHAKDYFVVDGVLPDLALVKVGLDLWATQRGAIFRVLTPDSPTFPPEIADEFEDEPWEPEVEGDQRD
ncbi:MAG: hypothetical protein ACFB0C_19685 [Leptolyngbyaceae cyanobacterium]